jgi:hypothetical protein
MALFSRRKKSSDDAVAPAADAPDSESSTPIEPKADALTGQDARIGAGAGVVIGAARGGVEHLDRRHRLISQTRAVSFGRRRLWASLSHIDFSPSNV